MNDQRIACLIAGFGVGVAVAILVTPRSGAETRNLIQQKAEAAGNAVKAKTNETNEYLKRRAGEAKAQASQAIERGKQVLDKQKEQLVSAVEAGKQAYRTAVENTVSAS